MSGAIWTSWQLWEKLCFILGCGIVLVIFAGCIKLIYNHYRIRKYTQIAAEKAQIREQLERTASFSRGRAKEIPFGVRALESGIEVDGVWISGSNTPANSTPAHSTPGSPTLGAVTDDSKTATPEKVASDRASLPSQMTRIEIPQPIYAHDDHRQPLHTGAVGRPNYQPRRSSGLRFSDSTELYAETQGDQAAALAALEGHSIGFGPAAEVREAHRRSKSWATTSWNETWNESHDPASGSSQAASHRALLHPLHPYHDPATRLGGFPSNRSNTQEPDDDDDVTETPDMRQTSAVYGPNHGRSPLSFEDLPDERTYQNLSPYMEDYQLSTNNDAFSSPVRPNTHPADSADPTPKDVTITPPRSAVKAQLQHHDIKPGPTFHNVSLDKTLVQYPHETISQPRRSQVVRKINSGFEILRPGTLGQSRKKSGGALSGDAADEEEGQGKQQQRQSRRLYRRRGEANLGKS